MHPILSELMLKLHYKKPWKLLDRVNGWDYFFSDIFTNRGFRPSLPGTPSATKLTKSAFSFDNSDFSPATTTTTRSLFEMETFYDMFTKLLDKKIEEIRGVVQAEANQQIADTDIPDNYIEQIQPPPPISNLVIHF